jgi:GST-like protein
LARQFARVGADHFLKGTRPMIDLYTWGTPNGRKASVMLEELGLQNAVHPVDIGKGEQFDPAFLKICPNGRIPAIVDPDVDGEPISVFETGAILIYLAEKTGSELLPVEAHRRANVLQWLMWQMGGIGPMFGQVTHFALSAPDNEYGLNRYMNEAMRLFDVLEGDLADRPFMCGDYSIADIATYPWVAGKMQDWLPKFRPGKWQELENVRRWFDAVGGRPAVKRGMAVP